MFMLDKLKNIWYIGILIFPHPSEVTVILLQLFLSQKASLLVVYSKLLQQKPLIAHNIHIKVFCQYIAVLRLIAYVY